MEETTPPTDLFYAWDISSRAIESAKQNAKMAKVDHLITFERKDFAQVTKEEVMDGQHSIVTDPPYGVRLHNDESIEELYRMIGTTCNTLFLGWNVSLLCGNKELLSFVDMKPNRTNSLFNGPIEAQLAHYYVFTEEERNELIQRAIKKKSRTTCCSS